MKGRAIMVASYLPLELTDKATLEVRSVLRASINDMPRSEYWNFRPILSEH